MNKKNLYNMSCQEVEKLYNTSSRGLSDEQVTSSKNKYGENLIVESEKPGMFKVFLSQFKDLLVVILIVAAIISIFSGNIESTLVIIFVLILNAILGTAQYMKAEKSLESLKNLSSPKAKVIRNGHKIETDSKDIVAGDIVLLEAGDIVPADGRIMKCYSLKVNESSLTGESESVEKFSDAIDYENVTSADQKNMVFSGSLVTYGRAFVLITSVGMNTELGKIAKLMNETKDRKTPLQTSLDKFGKNLSIIIISICIAVFFLSMYRSMPILDSLMFAVALAVAAIPEALSSIVTISLAIGTSKMAEENAIIKNLRAVEGLGCVSIICSDKTGTLTQNKMTVASTFTLERNHEEKLLLSSILCNDTSVSPSGLLGDPTETALVYHYEQLNDDYAGTIKKFPRIAEIPFDSERKLMSTVHNIDGVCKMFTKGAVDVLCKRLTHKIDKDGNTIPISEDDIKEIETANLHFSMQGLRVLSFAEKIITKEKTSYDKDDEHDMIFLGLISMMDPPRIESHEAVEHCKLAGIKPIMITGDHKITASAIAKKIGILEDGQLAITGSELDSMSDEEFMKKLPEISVYARVSPEHKIKIVNAWQSLGNIVAMTGDGVNDAPALKKSDIGIAMGITGTEVSKDAASMILTDDNFATIVKAVANGRNIYNNIKNSIKFLLSGNASGIAAVLYTSLAALPVPFAPVHLLFINLLTDSLPALAVSMEKSRKDLLKEKPRSSDESILTKDFIIEFVIQGILIAAATIFAYHCGLKTNVETAQTMAFATLCFARLWHGFNSRSKASIVKLGLFSNMFSMGAFVLGTLLLASALFIPALSSIFMVAPLSGHSVAVIALCAVAPTILIQLKRILFEIFTDQLV